MIWKGETMMHSLLLISFFVAAFIFSHLYKKWSLGAFFVFPVPFIFSLSPNEGCLWIATFVCLTICDIRKKRERSVFIQYNPLVKNSKLSKTWILFFSILGMAVSIVKLIMIIIGK
jgi:hypothetical protein